MFRARFISGLCDFMRHFNFRYFARATFNRIFFNYKKFYQIIRLELELATTSLLD